MREHLAGAPHGDPLERLAQLDQLVAVLLGEAADDQLAARADLDQPLLQEQPERLADRASGSGRARPRSRSPRAARRPEAAAQDPVTQVLVGPLGELAAAARHAAPAGDRMGSLSAACAGLANLAIGCNGAQGRSSDRMP